MSRQKKATTKSPSPSRKAREAVIRSTRKKIANMTPAELKQFIAEGNKLLGLFVPSMEAASSDVLAVIMAAGMEFCRRYYPTAESAFFCIHFDRKSKRSMTSISIPVPAETAETIDRHSEP